MDIIRLLDPLSNLVHVKIVTYTQALLHMTMTMLRKSTTITDCHEQMKDARLYQIRR